MESSKMSENCNFAGGPFSTNLIFAQERCASVDEQVHRYGLTLDNRCFHPVNRN